MGLSAQVSDPRPRSRLWLSVRQRLRAMGIRDKPIAPRSPWQNGFAERLIGSIRRECLDHMIVFGEAHLRRVLRSYASYYNETRTHRSLDKDAPMHRPIQRLGPEITSDPRRTSSPVRPDLVFGTHSFEWRTRNGGLEMSWSYTRAARRYRGKSCGFGRFGASGSLTLFQSRMGLNCGAPSMDNTVTSPVGRKV